MAIETRGMNKENNAFGKYYKRPILWGVGYIGVIIVFALIYFVVPETEWGGCEGIGGFLDSLYFSVVTITSLGFGDTYPIAGSLVRILIIIEAITGILIIGFFLNDVAMSQAKHLDSINKQNENSRRYREAKHRLKQYLNVLKPVIERYLCGVFEVVTPTNIRSNNYPQDILSYEFRFQMKDICDLFKESFLMTNGYKEPAIVAYFKNQDVLYEEIRMFATTADLSYWPELESALFKFITLHQEFQYKDAIISDMNIYLGSGEEKTKFTDHICESIKGHDGNLKFRPSNAMTPYEVLYVTLKENVSTIKMIYELMKEKSQELSPLPIET